MINADQQQNKEFILNPHNLDADLVYLANFTNLSIK